MTVEITTIKGCGHEKAFARAYVDLAYPEWIGRNPNTDEGQICPFHTESLHGKVKLRVEETMQMDKEKMGKIAKLIISCQDFDCPFHR